MLIGLLHDLSPVSAARLQWLLQENDALTRPVSAAARVRPAGLVAGLWRRAGLQPARQPASELEALFRAPAESIDDAAGAGDDAGWQIGARALWSMLVGRLGREWTLSALLERLTGENVLEEVRLTLIRHLAAHLDLGMSSWRNPEADAGLLRCLARECRRRHRLGARRVAGGTRRDRPPARRSAGND